MQLFVWIHQLCLHLITKYLQGRGIALMPASTETAPLLTDGQDQHALEEELQAAHALNADLYDDVCKMARQRNALQRRERRLKERCSKLEIAQYVSGERLAEQVIETTRQRQQADDERQDALLRHAQQFGTLRALHEEHLQILRGEIERLKEDVTLLETEIAYLRGHLTTHDQPLRVVSRTRYTNTKAHDLTRHQAPENASSDDRVVEVDFFNRVVGGTVGTRRLHRQYTTFVTLPIDKYTRLDLNWLHQRFPEPTGNVLIRSIRAFKHFLEMHDQGYVLSMHHPIHGDRGEDLNPFGHCMESS